MKLQIEKIVYGGDGLAHQNEGAEAGRAVFVPFTLPGELVEADLLAEKNGYTQATLAAVVERSKDRVEAECIHFGQCGGCQLQHADYSAQLRIKTEILQETLERAGLKDLPEIQVHSGENWEYRNRIRLRVARFDGRIRLGYNRRGGNEFLPITECPIAAPLLWRAAAALLPVDENASNGKHWLGAAAGVELFANLDQTKLQMTFFAYKDISSSSFSSFCERVRVAVPELAGAGVMIVPRESAKKREADRPMSGARWGAAGLGYEAAGLTYWVSRGGFFQVNRFLVDTMVRLVTGGRRGKLAWDLYAGVGLFSRALAQDFQQVVAVEGGETAALDLSRAFKGPGMLAVRASTVDFLRAAVVQRERPDLIVMDPPRPGVGAEVCEFLGRLKTPEIVYVSCDPVTLSRDLRLLETFGYKLEKLHLVDMFPQTFHLETITVLRR